MNFVMMMFPNFGSGSTSRFSAEWRRDILSVPQVPRGLLGTLRAVLRTALLAVLDALGVEDAAENVVAHAGQVLDAAAADHDHRVLLQVMALTRDVADHLETVGQAHLGDLAKRRVRLLRGRRIDARAHAALLRRLLQRRHLLARLLHLARTCDQLVDRRHLGLHLPVRAKPLLGFAKSFNPRGYPPRRARPARENYSRKAKSRQPPIAERKALRRHRGPRYIGSTAYAVQPATEVMHPNSISRGRALKNQNRPGIA